MRFFSAGLKKNDLTESFLRRFEKQSRINSRKTGLLVLESILEALDVKSAFFSHILHGFKRGNTRKERVK